MEHSRLLEVVDYCSATGVFKWKQTMSSRATAGTVAGARNTDGYIRIAIDKKRYPAHRLAWFYVYKEWPTNLIDHINRVKDDNRIINLRPADHSQNRANSRINSNSASGIRGVRWSEEMKKWKACITKNKKYVHVGYFETLEEACLARTEHANKLFGSFAEAS